MRSVVMGMAAGMAMALPAGGHPHVFVETTMRVIVEDGRAVAVDVTWAYDDFISLLAFEDLGLDRDADGVLTEAELDTLMGFDLRDWPPEFEGDLYAWTDGEKLEMPRPVPVDVRVEDGRIVATHRRSLNGVPAETLELKQYDPTYFVAYTVREVSASGGCKPRVRQHDPSAAEEALANALQEVPEDQFEVLQLGGFYADKVRLICDGSS